MLKNIVSLSLIAILLLLGACEETPKQSNEIDAKVSELLKKMTLEEKVGQMTQVTVGLIMKKGAAYDIDESKLKEAVVTRKVGSILNTQDRAYSLEEWHLLIESIQKLAMEETPNQIPVIYGIDAIHGANYIQEGTLFPHNIGMAASRNLALARSGAEIAALETRASGIRWNFDPVLGVGRQPLWSRFEETFGEDVYLTSSMGVATIKGYEGENLKGIQSVASCMKHYIGYSMPRSGKDRTPAYIPETELLNIFLPPFREAVAAGTSTVMINSGEVNGMPVHGSKYFLQDLLRDELGFDGLAVSDWEDIIRLHSRHKVAATPKEAVKIAVNAGIDMSMVPLDYSFYDYLLELVNEGEVSMARIDEAVGRILKLKFKLGLFNDPMPEEEAIQNFGSEDYRVAAKNAAIESITLLKNEKSALPISKDTKILLAGPGANNLPSLHGSWSFTWQGDDSSKYPSSTLTIKEAFENKFGKNNVLCQSKADYDDADNYDSKSITGMAKKADYIVLCLGEDAYAESPGVVDDLALDTRQVALAEALAATGKPMILLLTQGRPRIIREIEPLFDGIIMAYRPASQGANALADIVSGEVSPSGLLPFTYPQYSGDLLTYDHKYSETIREDIPNSYGSGGYRPQYAFGHGLSYTSFEYSDLTISSESLSANQSLTISVTVKNSGTMDAKHTVELYVRDRFASITPSVKMLKGYQKISLQAGATEKVTFELTPNDLSFVNASGQRVTEAGAFDLYIGTLEKSFNYQ